MANIVTIQEWRIGTVIDGVITSVDSNHEGEYHIYVNGDKAVNILLYKHDIMKISTKEGYAVQLSVGDKYMSIIKEA